MVELILQFIPIIFKGGIHCKPYLLKYCISRHWAPFIAMLMEKGAISHLLQILFLSGSRNLCWLFRTDNHPGDWWGRAPTWLFGGVQHNREEAEWSSGVHFMVLWVWFVQRSWWKVGCQVWSKCTCLEMCFCWRNVSCSVSEMAILVWKRKIQGYF